MKLTKGKIEKIFNKKKQSYKKLNNKKLCQYLPKELLKSF